MPLRILIADNHVLVRLGVRDVVRNGFPNAYIGEAADGREAIALVNSGQWDVVILDITMPRVSGFDALRTIHAARPDLPVVMLSMHRPDLYVRRSQELGASGYVTKDAEPELIIAALHAVLRGGTFFPSEFGPT